MMFPSKSVLAFLGIIAAGLTIVFLVSAGYYPIAVVNYHSISSRRFQKNYRAAINYYQKAVQIYNLKEADFKPDNIRAGVLEELIENILISVELKKELGSDFDFVLNNKLTQIENNDKLKEAASAIYELDFDDFKKEILIPQTQREILSSRLFIKNQKIDGWLEQAKESSRVYILSPQFIWKNGSVQTK